LLTAVGKWNCLLPGFNFSSRCTNSQTALPPQTTCHIVAGDYHNVFNGHAVSANVDNFLKEWERERGTDGTTQHNTQNTIAGFSGSERFGFIFRHN